MADELKRLNNETLEHARDMGAVTYLRCYLHLMTRALGEEPPEEDPINTMILLMIDPLNDATEAMWRAMMQDRQGMEIVLERMKARLMSLIDGDDSFLAGVDDDQVPEGD